MDFTAHPDCETRNLAKGPKSHIPPGIRPRFTRPVQGRRRAVAFDRVTLGFRERGTPFAKHHAVDHVARHWVGRTVHGGPLRSGWSAARRGERARPADRIAGWRTAAPSEGRCSLAKAPDARRGIRRGLWRMHTPWRQRAHGSRHDDQGRANEPGDRQGPSHVPSADQPGTLMSAVHFLGPESPANSQHGLAAPANRRRHALANSMRNPWTSHTRRVRMSFRLGSERRDGPAQGVVLAQAVRPCRAHQAGCAESRPSSLVHRTWGQRKNRGREPSRECHSLRSRATIGTSTTAIRRARGATQVQAARHAGSPLACAAGSPVISLPRRPAPAARA